MTVEPAFVFLAESGESLGDRVARCALEILRDGPMSRTRRPLFYKRIIACGWDPPLEKAGTWRNLGQGIETLATSCGIFVRCVFDTAGRKTTRPGVMGQPLVDCPRGKTGTRWGWCEGMSLNDEAWMDAAGNELRRGDVLLWGHHMPVGREGHVEIATRHVRDTIWQVAAGGGGGKGDGTLCRLEERDIVGLDAGYRKLLGWWRPERMRGWTEDAIPTLPDTEPAPPPESNP